MENDKPNIEEELNHIRVSINKKKTKKKWLMKTMILFC